MLAFRAVYCLSASLSASNRGQRGGQVVDVGAALHAMVERHAALADRAAAL